MYNSKDRNKKTSKKCYDLIKKKDIPKVKKAKLKWILQNISENQTFQRIAKFIMADFYKMDFMKGIVILVTADEMYKIFKSPLAYHFSPRDENE